MEFVGSLRKTFKCATLIADWMAHQMLDERDKSTKANMGTGEQRRNHFFAQSSSIKAQAFFIPPAILPPSLVFDKRSPSLFAT